MITLIDSVNCPYCGEVQPVEWKGDEGDNYLAIRCEDCEQPLVLMVNIIINPTMALRVEGCEDKPKVPWPDAEMPPHGDDR